eukprot:COSAG03_NODE_1731_length_3593_cov_87.784488_6_plen_134_part_00
MSSFSGSHPVFAQVQDAHASIDGLIEHQRFLLLLDCGQVIAEDDVAIVQRRCQVPFHRSVVLRAQPSVLTVAGHEIDVDPAAQILHRLAEAGVVHQFEEGLLELVLAPCTTTVFAECTSSLNIYAGKVLEVVQ